MSYVQYSNDDTNKFNGTNRHIYSYNTHFQRIIHKDGACKSKAIFLPNYVSYHIFICVKSNRLQYRDLHDVVFSVPSAIIHSRLEVVSAGNAIMQMQVVPNIANTPMMNLQQLIITWLEIEASCDKLQYMRAQGPL